MYVLPSPCRIGAGGAVRPRVGERRKGTLTKKEVKNIIIGNPTSPEKIKRAKELRQKMTPAEKILWEKLNAQRFNSLKFR